MKKFFKKTYFKIRAAVLKGVFFRQKETAFDSPPEKIRKILVIRTDRVGDMVLTLPAIREVKKMFPKSKLTVLCRPKMRDLIWGLPYIDGIVTNPKRLSFQREKFDLVIDFLKDYTLQTAWLAWTSGAKYRLGFDVAGRGVFFNLRGNPCSDEIHFVSQNLNLLKKLGKVSEEVILELPVHEEAARAVQDFKTENLLSNAGLLIGVSPGAYYPSQRWPAEKFAALSDRLVAELNASVVLIGSEEEIPLLFKIQQSMKQTCSLFPKNPLDEMAEMIRSCSLLICNNSGPLHIAAAVNTPSVSTAGPTNPKRWSPWGKNHTVVSKELSCLGCLEAVCPLNTHACMLEIGVEEMFYAAQRQLESLIKEKATA